MPVHKKGSGWQYGKHGKVYRSRKKAVKQGVAIKLSQLRRQGRRV